MHSTMLLVLAFIVALFVLSFVAVLVLYEPKIVWNCRKCRCIIKPRNFSNHSQMCVKEKLQ